MQLAAPASIGRLLSHGRLSSAAWPETASQRENGRSGSREKLDTAILTFFTVNIKNFQQKVVQGGEQQVMVSMLVAVQKASPHRSDAPPPLPSSSSFVLDFWGLLDRPAE
jgi:hypothetical protein